MQSDRERLLRDEAAYQDLKVEKNVRQELDKYYMDPAWKYLQKCKERMMGDLKGKRVLDLGCGKGGATMDALKKGALVTAIDISPKSIAFVREQAEAAGYGDRLEAAVMDAQALQLPDAVFDLVIGNGVLHHLPALKESMLEIRRVLKDGGYAVFVEPLGMNPLLNLYRKLTPGMRTKDEQPFRMKEIRVLQSVFPRTKTVFFDLTTLIAKFLMAIRLPHLAKRAQRRLIQLDGKLIRGKDSGRITFLQKMSWNLLVRMEK